MAYPDAKNRLSPERAAGFFMPGEKEMPHWNAQSKPTTPAPKPYKGKLETRRALELTAAIDNTKTIAGALVGGGGGGHQTLVRNAHLIGIAKRRDSEPGGAGRLVNAQLLLINIGRSQLS